LAAGKIDNFDHHTRIPGYPKPSVERFGTLGKVGFIESLFVRADKQPRSFRTFYREDEISRGGTGGPRHAARERFESQLKEIQNFP